MDQAEVSDRPLVSVLMCTYNGRPFIEKSVESIVGQSYPNWELVICDDASTDGTRQWLQAMPTDPRIRVFLHERNLGYVANKNFALEMARGELITQQDQDDWSSPERLQEQVEALARTGLEICGTGFRRVAPDGSLLFSRHPECEIVLARQPEGGYPFWFPGLLASRRVFERVGSFETYFAGVFGDDLYWTIRANEQFQIVCLPGLLYSYTDAPGSITSQADNPRKLVMEQILAHLADQRQRTGTDDLEQGNLPALQQLEQRLANSRTFVGRRYQALAARSLDQGCIANARQLLWRSFIAAPWRPSLIRTIAYLFRRSLFRTGR